MNDIMKIFKSLEDFGFLIKCVGGETIKNGAKEQKGEFLGIFLGTLGGSFLGKLLIGKGVIRAGERTIKTGEETNWTDKRF